MGDAQLRVSYPASIHPGLALSPPAFYPAPHSAAMITSCDFRFVCPMDWSAMADLPDGSGKHCDHCQRPVITVHNRRQFNAAAKRGDCVAYFPEGEEPTPRLTGIPKEARTTRLMGDPDLRSVAKVAKKRGKKGE